MVIWIDAQLSPHLAVWLAKTFDVEAFSVEYLGLRDVGDSEIFDAARAAGAVVVTKDIDFVELVHRRGMPPQVIWITCGNTSMAYLRKRLATVLPEALALVNRGEPIVEISGARRTHG